MMPAPSAFEWPADRVERWPISKLIPYARNARTHSDAQVKQIAASMREWGWTIPVLIDEAGMLIAGHGRIRAAELLGWTEAPVMIAHGWSDAKKRAYAIADNKLALNAGWDEAMLGAELLDLSGMGVDLGLTGFTVQDLDKLLRPGGVDPKADEVPPLPAVPMARAGDLWLCGPHRVLCGDCTSPEAVGRVLGERKPLLMVTDPPYGIELDTEWRDRAGLNGGEFGIKRSAADKAKAKADKKYQAEPSYMKHRTEGHTETSISGDVRADWSDAFALVPSLEVAYVWHASRFTREVLDGLLKIGFLHHQQIIWNKLRTVLTRTHYWFQHEPCWYVRKKNAPWYGKAGENSTIWDSPSPKFIMGGSDEEKYDHPTQKPVDLMRRPILNHLTEGGLVYEPFLGSGTTLAAAEVSGRVCCGVELDPKYVDVIVQRWQTLSGKDAVLDGDGRTYSDVVLERQGVPV
jgi:DNA modification methylase